ncbi:unnamed protein product [Linum tenue]|uniref:lipoyl(octanoyl) transferase n=1 Tax=Linum tenue TaxID=586396 RepID=A0AAV0QCE7_9ROSI|nr:unnamed protein product [Linum tenue]
MILQAGASSCFSSIPPCPISSSNRQPSSLTTPNFISIRYRNGRMCEFHDLHKELVPYADAWKWQKDIVAEKKALVETNHDCPDTLIVLQHHPVYTLGMGSSLEHLNFDMNDAPLDVYRTERGGEVTYHGPGQLVIYPIVNLRNHKMDIHWYLRALEEVIIRVLSSAFSIEASRVDGLTGVWFGMFLLYLLNELQRDHETFVIMLSGDQKLAAIGVKVSRWIAYHGVALNVTTDLAPFKSIVPCGIKDRRVGSIKSLLGIDDDDDTQLIETAYKSLIKEFSEVFDLGIQQIASSPILEGLEP